MFALFKKNADIPEQNKINALKDILTDVDQHTPDRFWLEHKENWLVFLYCNLQLTHPGAVDDAEFKWWGFTKRPLSVWKNPLGKLSHPVAFEWDERLRTVNYNRVKGQVVLMPTERLIKLDRERQNGVQFKRKRIPIEVPYSLLKEDRDRWINQHSKGKGYLKGDKQLFPVTQTMWAWAYYGIPNYWMDSPVRISPIKIQLKDGRKTTEFIMNVSGKTVSSCARYLPNDNGEPYYYYSPIE